MMLAYIVTARIFSQELLFRVQIYRRRGFSQPVLMSALIDCLFYCIVFLALVYYRVGPIVINIVR